MKTLLVIFISFIYFCNPAYSYEGHKFNPTITKQSTLCENIYDGAPYVGENTPDLFGNVKNVLIGANKKFGGPELDISVFDLDFLTSLAACKITRDYGENIYILPEDYPDTADVDKPGNLTILIDASLAGYSTKEWKAAKKIGKSYDLNGKIVVVMVTFYRKDVHDFRVGHFNCANAFIYTNDKSTTQKRMKEAVQSCLVDPFWKN